MADLAAKVLQLSPEQHEMLGHAIALAHAVHAPIGGKGLGVAPGELHDAYTTLDRVDRPRARIDSRSPIDSFENFSFVWCGRRCQ